MVLRERRRGEDTDFTDLVRREAFGHATGEEASFLRSPDGLERWVSELIAVVSSIKGQIDNHNAGVRLRDDEWHHNATHVKARYDRRLSEAKPLLAALRASWHHGDAAAVLREMERLRAAIRAHEQAARMAEADPEPWDLDLWHHITRNPNQ